MFRISSVNFILNHVLVLTEHGFPFFTIILIISYKGFGCDPSVSWPPES